MRRNFAQRLDARTTVRSTLAKAEATVSRLENEVGELHEALNQPGEQYQLGYERAQQKHSRQQDAAVEAIQKSKAAKTVQTFPGEGRVDWFYDPAQIDEAIADYDHEAALS